MDAATASRDANLAASYTRRMARLSQTKMILVVRVTEMNFQPPQPVCLAVNQSSPLTLLTSQIASARSLTVQWGSVGCTSCGVAARLVKMRSNWIYMVAIMEPSFSLMPLARAFKVHSRQVVLGRMSSSKDIRRVLILSPYRSAGKTIQRTYMKKRELVVGVQVDFGKLG